EQYFGAVGKEFRRAALRYFNVRQLVTENAVIRLAKRGQRKRIGRRSVKDKKHFAVRLEHVSNKIGSLLRPGIVAVTHFMALIGLCHGGERLRANARIVVTGELAATLVYRSHRWS